MYSSLLTLLLALGLAGGIPSDPPYEFGSDLERMLTMVQQIKCESRSGRGRLADLKVWVAVPQSNERQKILSIEYRPKPTSIEKDKYGNTYAMFTIPEVRSGKQVSVGWKAHVRTRSIRHRVDGRQLRPLSETPASIRSLYLGDGTMYDLKNRSLQAAAREAGRGARNALDLAFNINEYVRRKLCYLNDGKWDSSAITLKNGHGSCSEYNFLFMSLCRLNGLAARFVGASALRGDAATYKDTVHHRWTEVYLPGHGWFPVDVSRNDGEEHGNVNSHFGSTSDRLLVTIRGDGGSHMPLEWGYVARIKSHSVGDAKMRRSKNFLWEPAGEMKATRLGN